MYAGNCVFKRFCKILISHTNVQYHYRRCMCSILNVTLANASNLLRMNVYSFQRSWKMASQYHAQKRQWLSIAKPCRNLPSGNDHHKTSYILPRASFTFVLDEIDIGRLQIAPKFASRTFVPFFSWRSKLRLMHQVLPHYKQHFLQFFIVMSHPKHFSY